MIASLAGRPHLRIFPLVCLTRMATLSVIVEGDLSWPYVENSFSRNPTWPANHQDPVEEIR